MGFYFREEVRNLPKELLDRDKVEQLFKDHTHQSDVIIELYKMVFPDWDRIEKLEGFPTINRVTSEKIALWFMEFDRKHHPNCIPGGLWINNGFSTLEAEKLGVENWAVDTGTTKPIYKEGVNAF